MGWVEAFTIISVLVLMFGSGFVAQYVASARGRKEKWYFWLGFWLPIVGILIAFGTPPAPDDVPQRPASAQKPTSISAELDELAGLHKSGDLTDGEFEAAKRRVIGG